MRKKCERNSLNFDGKIVGETSDWLPIRRKEKSKIAGFRIHGKIYGMEFIAILSRLTPESSTGWQMSIAAYQG